MKNIFKTSLLFILCSTIITSCDDKVDILPIAPNSENYFNNEEEYEDALIGVYDMLQTTMYNVMVAHTASDDIIAGGDPNAFDQPTLQRIDKMSHTPADNEQIQLIWQLMYAGVNRANYVLEFKDKTDFDGKEDLIAQVYFLRAYFVFELAKYFGDIPLFTEKRNEVRRIVDARVLFGDQYTINRVGSVDAVYELIEEDLKEAIPNLATTRPNSEIYKIKQATAQALLGKVYLYHKKYTDAATQLKAVINSGDYELVTGANFTNLFTADGENSSESVFEVQYTGVVGNNWDCLYCNAGNYMPQTNGPRAKFNNPIYREGWGINIFSKNINDAFQNGDLRKNITIFAPTTGFYGESRENTGFYNKKYLTRKDEATVSSDPVSYQNNYRAIRYADVLLMAAEAEAQSGGTNAINYLNQVRERAFDNTSHDYPYNGESNLLQAIYDERRLELAGEGHRFFDLVRTNKAKEAFDAYNNSLEGDDIDDREIDFTVGTNEIFPIPLVELNLANAVETWKQNPGYN
jgi:starch-binding outer membrane protein, SusD/RagB family